jgi:hypothetical protein
VLSELSDTKTQSQLSIKLGHYQNLGVGCDWVRVRPLQIFENPPSMEAGISDHVWSLDEGDRFIGLRTMEVEYMPGDVVPVTSALYRVVHDPPEAGQHLETFIAGDRFPFCSECGRKVRYALPSRVLRKKFQTEPLPKLTIKAATSRGSARW